MRVAVLGTGIMGAGMAKNLDRAGHDVVVWNRTRSTAEEVGTPVAATPQEAVTGADVAVTVLRDLAAVEEATADVDFGTTVWMQSSTVGLGIEDLAARAEERGVTLVDAPLSGSRQAAEDGALTVLVSGAEEARRAIVPVAEAVGRKTVEVGDRVGDATRFKLVMNSWVATLVEGTAELMAFAQASGLDPEQVLAALEGGPLDAGYLQQKGRAILDGDFSPQFKLETAAKDIGLIRELAARSGLGLALMDATADRFARAIESGHGDEDWTATWYATRRAG